MRLKKGWRVRIVKVQTTYGPVYRIERKWLWLWLRYSLYGTYDEAVQEIYKEIERLETSRMPPVPEVVWEARI